MITIKEILDIANSVYPDGYLAHYYDEKGHFKQGHGDTLAAFIVNELIDRTKEGSRCTRLTSASKLLEDAIHELELVIDALDEAHEHEVDDDEEDDNGR
jgi:hypothetical protein